ncbi:hypothetical protein CW703_06910 [Candidatus Bathyarchaeota archaeon]|nr:MAG: hypothetical protein CW703_06910 [Candidatus Bathyarchaeota archaeon]
MAYVDQTKVAVVIEGVDKTSKGLDQARKNIQRFEQQVEKTTQTLRQRFAGAATTIANVTSSALNLYNAYDRLAAVQARLMSLEASLKSARAGYMRVQQRLNKLIAEGKQGTEEYARELERLEAYEIRIRQYTLQLEDAQDEVAKTYMQMALSVVPLLTTTLTQLGTVGLTSVITGFKGAALAAKGMLISMGPIGWVLMGLTAAITVFAIAWQNNWGGIREKVQAFCNWFKTIYDTYIRPVFEAIGNGFRWLGEAIWNALNWIWEKLLWFVENNPLFLVVRHLIPQVNQAWQDFKSNVTSCNQEVAVSTQQTVSQVNAGFNQVQSSIQTTTSQLKLSAEEWQEYLQETEELTRLELEAMADAPSQVPPAFQEMNNLTQIEQQRFSLLMENMGNSAKSMANSVSEATQQAKMSLSDLLAKYESTIKKLGGMESYGVTWAWSVPVEHIGEFEYYTPEPLQKGGIVKKPTLALLGERGPEAVIPLEHGTEILTQPVNITINGPLVNVEGSADRFTAELAAELVEEKLKNVIIEATSSQAKTKTIRMV